MADRPQLPFNLRSYDELLACLCDYMLREVIAWCAVSAFDDRHIEEKMGRTATAVAHYVMEILSAEDKRQLLVHLQKIQVVETPEAAQIVDSSPPPQALEVRLIGALLSMAALAFKKHQRRSLLS